MSFAVFIALWGVLLLRFLGIGCSWLMERIAIRLPRLSVYAGLPAIVCAVLVLVCAWVLRGSTFELVIGGWSPISLTGSPLVLANSAPAAAVLIVLSLIDLQLTLNAAQSDHTRRAWLALAFVGLCLLAFSNSSVTLLMGLGLVDGCALLAHLNKKESKAATSQLLLNGISLALLLLVFALHLAEGNSAYLPISQLPNYLNVWLDIALVCRFGVLPLITPATRANTWWQPSAIATLLLMAQLPRLGATERSVWLIMLLTFSWAVTSVLALIRADHPQPANMLAHSAFYATCLSCVTGQSSVIAAACVAWLIGFALVQTRIQKNKAWQVPLELGLRLFGVGVWGGLPITVGFIGQAGIANTLAQLGGWGIFALVFWVIGLTTFIAASLRFALSARSSQVFGNSTFVPFIPKLILVLLPMLLLAAHAVLFGLVPQLVGANGLNQPVARNGMLGWATWLAAVGAGIALWWFESRWLPRIEFARERYETFAEMRWLHEIWNGALNRLAKPFRVVFPFLESDGVLLWAVIVIMLVVLVNRPGGP